MKTFNNVAKLIRDRRVKSGHTQESLSVELGLKSPQYISNIERGKSSITLSKSALLCKILEIERHDLINAIMLDCKYSIIKEVSESFFKLYHERYTNP